MRIHLKYGGRLWLCFIIAGILGLAQNAGSSDTGPLAVYVVNYPLQYFAERIGGGHVAVTFPAPADDDPAYWIPDIATIAAYQQADLILLNGAGYARWVRKVSLPRSRIIDTSRKFADQYITTADAVTHSHGPEGEHAHESLAFTTWIDFGLAARQAEAICAAFIRKLPQQRQTFEQNLAALRTDLMALDTAMREIVGQDPARPMVASHPVYDYLARAYGMNIKSVHWEPDEIPNASQWLELQRILEDHPSAWMIWEGQPSTDTTAKLKTMGIGSIVFNPCGNVPDKGDFLSMMRQNLENLAKGSNPD